MKTMKGFWIALAFFAVALSALQLMNAAGENASITHIRVSKETLDSSSSPKLGYPFSWRQYNFARVNSSSGTMGALSADVVDIHSVNNGRKVFTVLTVSEDAGVSKSMGSAVMFGRSYDFGSTWSDLVTIDPVVMTGGAPMGVVTGNAISFDVASTARIARAGDNIFVAWLSTANQIGGKDRGAPTGHVSLDNAARNYTGAMRAHAFKNPNRGTSISNPETGISHGLDAQYRVWITASTDDGASWQTPRMIPTQYDKYVGSGRGIASEYSAGGAVPANQRTASVTYESALPGSLQLVALGDGTSIDRVYVAWLDSASYDSASNGLGGVKNRIGNFDLSGGVLSPHFMATTRPYFAVLTFDNTRADAGAVNAINYVVSGPAFNRVGTIATGGGTPGAYGFSSSWLGGTGTASPWVTWDKIKLHGVGPSVNLGAGDVTLDKVWVVGHYLSRGLAAAEADGARAIAVASFDDVAAWATRGGANGSLFPRFWGAVTVDHTGFHRGVNTAGNAEEFDFDSYLDGNFDTAQLFVFLTSNGAAKFDQNGAVSTTMHTDTTPTGMYLVNMMDSAWTASSGISYQLVSRVSYDTALRAESSTVTYSVPKVTVLGDGLTNTGAVSNDMVVMAFEASGITRDDIAGWASNVRRGFNSTAVLNAGPNSGYGYLSLDNVYVISNLRSGRSHISGYTNGGFNFTRASRVDAYSRGQTYGGNTSNVAGVNGEQTTSSNKGATTTHDSVSTDSILKSIHVARNANINGDTETVIAVTFLDNTPGGNKGRVTYDRCYGDVNRAGVAIVTRNRNVANGYYDLFLGSTVIQPGKNPFDQYQFSGLRVSSESVTQDDVSRYKVAAVSWDRVNTHLVSKKSLNESYFDMSFNYLSNIRTITYNGKTTALAGRDTGPQGAAAMFNANYDAFAKLVKLGALFDPLRDSSDNGVCLIGRGIQADRFRR